MESSTTPTRLDPDPEEGHKGREEGRASKIPMRCRKCRFLLLEYPDVRVQDSHGKPYTNLSDDVNTTKGGGGACHSDVCGTSLKSPYRPG